MNTNAELLLRAHAFGTWDVHAVRIRTAARNELSCRAIERLGLHRDRVIRAERAAVDGAVRDS